MKKITLIFMLLATAIFSWQSTSQVSIGIETNTDSSLPINAYFGYSYSQSIYDASEINATGDITEISFKFNGNSTLANSSTSWVVYIGHTTKTVFDNTTDWVPLTSLTQVYSGSITAVGAGDETITIDITDFAYNGTDNLVIAVEDDQSGYDDSLDVFYSSNTVGGVFKSICYYSDSTNPDPATPPSGTLVSQVPNIIFGGITQTCPNPSDLAVSAITTTSVQLDWTDNASASEWEYVVQAAGTGEPVGAGTTTMTNPVIDMSLTASTSYEVYIRAVCSTTDSSGWFGPVNFVSQCDPFGDFTEDFDASTDGEITLCWDSLIDSSSAFARVSMEDNASNANSGDFCAELYNSDDDASDMLLISPSLTAMQTGDHRIRFMAMGTGVEPAVLVGTMSDPADIDSFIGISGIDLTASYAEYSVVIDSAPAGHNYIAIQHGHGDTFQTIRIDDFTWEPTPSCIEPSDVFINNITALGADFSWTENNSPAATAWDLYIVPAGDAAPDAASTPTENDATNPKTWAAGTANTNYDVYVRTDCGLDNTDVSTWVGPFSFKTLCATYTAPYTEDFEDAGNLDSCWTQDAADDFDWTANSGGTPSPGTGPSAADSGTYYIYTETSGVGLGSTAIVYSPSIDISAMVDPRLNFAYHMYGAAMDTDGNIDVAISTDGGATYASIFNVAGDQGNQWNNSLVPLSSYTGVVSFRITGTVSTTGSAFQNDFAIDNFKVEETPAAAPDCATNIVVTEVDVNCGNMGFTGTWDPVADADGYKLTIGTTSGGNDIMDMVDLGNVTSFTSEATLLNTQYFYTLTPYNVVGDATGCTESSITTGATGCYCDSMPNSNDGNGVANVNIEGTDFTSLGDVTYEDHTAAAVVNMIQGINNSVQITFETGYSYHTNIWVDLNDDYTFDASELVYQGESTDADPTTLDASFLMPAAATLGNHRMRIGTADFGQATPNPCYNGSFGVTLDFTINIVVATCAPAIATTTVVPDCANTEYSIDVDVTTVGDATAITDGTTTWPISSTGVISVGPFANASSVSLSITHTDATCDFSLGTFMYVCPPVNDNCADAIPLTVGADFAANPVTGTNIGATDSGETAPGCGGFSGGDVWYSVVVPSDGIVTVDTSNVDFTDSGMAIYSGVCGSLVLVECDDDDSDNGLMSKIELTGQTPGDILYIRVWEYGNNAFGDFQISAINPNVAATNDLATVGFNYYPNPVTNSLTMTANENITSVSIFNMLGQEVRNEKLSALEANIDMSNLSNGTYFVRAQVGKSVGTFKIVKK